MSFRLLVFTLLSLNLGGLAGAERAGPQPHPGEPGGPRGGQGIRRPGFAETLRVLAAAGKIARQLQAGTVRVQPTPQGPRLTLPLTYQGTVVASVLLRPDGTFAARGELPGLPDAQSVTLGAAARARAAAQVAGFTVSGAVEQTPRDYQVVLLLAGQPVTQLHLAPDTLQPRPDDGPGSGPRGGGKRR